MKPRHKAKRVCSCCDLMITMFIQVTGSLLSSFGTWRLKGKEVMKKCHMPVLVLVVGT